MILICQPKSGSTSLIDTFHNCGYKTVEVYNKPGSKLDDFKHIQKYHSNTDVRDKFVLQDIIQSEMIYREHLLPCTEHFTTIEDLKMPCLILLRNPFHSFDSYRRYLQVYGQEAPEGLLEDLTKFNLYWRRFAKDKNYMIVINYTELVQNFKKTFASIIAHFNLKIDVNYDTITLSKRLYTGIGEARLKNESD